MDIKRQFDELIRMREMIESDEFQKFIMKPLYEEIGKLKDAYDCESLRELHAIKGKKQGLKWMIENLKELDIALKNAKHDIETLDKEA
jgi:hypothetical protein